MAGTDLPGIDEMQHATTRYLAALTRLDATSLRRPSVLPGWSRAHVVAHVSRNADALERVLTSAGAGEAASMYDAPGSRDFDIEETARLHDLPWLVRDAEASARRLARAAAVYDASPDTPYTRLPGDAETFPVATVCPRRRTEVEVHHADLDVGYAAADWPADFSLDLVSRRQDELASLPQGGPSMVLSATDVPGLWRLGAGGGPEIHGSVGDLAYWLVGRGGGHGLTSSWGTLPRLARWR